MNSNATLGDQTRADLAALDAVVVALQAEIDAIPASYTTAQVDTLLAAKAATVHVHSGADITTGTVADARLSAAAQDAVTRRHDASTLGTANGLSLSGQALSLATATTSAAGAMSGADKTKLDGIATSATANATDAQLRDRTTHTGSQAISTVTSLQASLDAKVNKAGDTMAGNLLLNFYNVEDVHQLTVQEILVSNMSIGDAQISWENDTNLYRSALDTLKTDDAFVAASFNGPGSGLTSLSASNISSGTLDGARLPTGINAANIGDGTVSSTEFQYLNSLTSNAQTQITSKAPLASPPFTGTLTIGTDTNLYRSAADTLKTDDALIVGSTLATGGTITVVNGSIQLPYHDGLGVGDLRIGSTSSSVQGMNLFSFQGNGNNYFDCCVGVGCKLNFRVYNTSFAPAVVNFDSSVEVAGTLTLGGDTNLYRSAANRLKTDDALLVGDPADAGVVFFADITTGSAKIGANYGDYIKATVFDTANGGRIWQANDAGNTAVNMFQTNAMSYFGVPLQATEFHVGANKVVGAQGASVADASDAASAITQLNALLARLRTHGLIAT